MRALVFSAGGTFGAYQAGAWQAIEEAGFQPQIVVGASIGAVNATAVASGCKAVRLQQWWRDPRSNVFRWNWPPRSLGLRDNRSFLARLQEFRKEFSGPLPGIQLLITLTELPSTRIRVVADRAVTAEHLLASCAVPFLFAPMRVDGLWTTDGGLFNRLPLEVALRAGATDIIAVDALAAPPSLLVRRVLTAAAGLRRLLLREPALRSPYGLRSVACNKPLGSMLDPLRWDLTKVDRWIEVGYRDAERALRNPSAAQAATPSNESTAPAYTEIGR